MKVKIVRGFKGYRDYPVIEKRQLVSLQIGQTYDLESMTAWRLIREGVAVKA